MTYNYRMILLERREKLYKCFDFYCTQNSKYYKIRLVKTVNLLKRINSLLEN